MARRQSTFCPPVRELQTALSIMSKWRTMAILDYLLRPQPRPSTSPSPTGLAPAKEGPASWLNRTAERPLTSWCETPQAPTTVPDWWRPARAPPFALRDQRLQEMALRGGLAAAW